MLAERCAAASVPAARACPEAWPAAASARRPRTRATSSVASTAGRRLQNAALEPSASGAAPGVVSEPAIDSQAAGAAGPRGPRQAIVATPRAVGTVQTTSIDSVASAVAPSARTNA